MKANPADYIFAPLGDHNLAAFSCSKRALEEYIKKYASQDVRRKYASQDVRRKLATVFVVSSKNEPRRVIGYYSLSNSSVRLEQLPPDLLKKAGKYKILPVTLLGRMAIDDAYRSQGFGELVLMEALHQALSVAHRVASFAVFTEAKDKEAASFYEKYGFLRLPEDKLKLFIPMKTLEKLFSES